MAKKSESNLATSDYRYLGGKTRQFQNINTGEILSRRQYERRVLNRESFESKAARNRLENEILQRARPAKGRKTSLSEYRTGRSTGDLEAIARRYGALSGFRREFYLEYNTRTQHYGTLFIKPKYLMMLGVATSGKTADAINERRDIIALIKSILLKAEKWKGALAYQIQVFANSSNGVIEPVSSKAWVHDRRLLGEEFQDELMQIMTVGVLDGSNQGPVVAVTFRVFFNSDTMAKYSPMAVAKRTKEKEKHKVRKAKAAKIRANKTKVTA